MKIAYVMFNQMTTMDFDGFYEVVTWMLILGKQKEMSWDFCALEEEIVDDRGMKIKMTQVKPDLSTYDVVFFAGGMATRQLIYDNTFIEWIKTARNVRYKASVCTGSLLMGAAGFLEGKRATTNPSAYELLTPFCSTVVKQRLVREGNIFMSGGAGSSLELGLLFVEALTDSAFVKQVQEKIDFPYYEAGKLGDKIY